MCHALGRGARAAHQPLELWILVRIQAPQPFLPDPATAGLLFYRGLVNTKRLVCMSNMRAVPCKIGFMAKVEEPAVKSYFLFAPLEMFLIFHRAWGD